MLTTTSLRRRTPRDFLASRLVRLGVPVLAYAVLVWPVLEWLVERAQSGTTLWGFYARAFSVGHWQQRGTGPMWFVAVLLVATTGWCLWRWRFPARPSGTAPLATVAMAVLVVAVGTFLVRTRFPVDSPQFLDVHVWIWPQAVALFVLGAVGAERGWITPVPRTVRRTAGVAVPAAFVGLGVMILLSDGPEPFKGGWHWQAAGLAVCEGTISVGASLLLLDWARRRVTSEGRVGQAWAGAAYGAFVAQGPVLVLVALLLRPLDLPGDVKFVLLATTGVLGSFACGDAFRRLTSPHRHT